MNNKKIINIINTTQVQPVAYLIDSRYLRILDNLCSFIILLVNTEYLCLHDSMPDLIRNIFNPFIT